MPPVLVSWAIERDDLALLEVLIRRGAILEDERATGTTPLMAAVAGFHHGAVQLLLERGADPGHRAWGGETPLLRAAQGGDRGIVEMLLARGAAPDVADDRGITPLMYAAHRGNVAVMELLLARRVAVDAATGDGRTALMLAAESGQEAAAAMLLAAGAAPVLRDRRDWSAGRYAAAKGHARLARALAHDGDVAPPTRPDALVELLARLRPLPSRRLPEDRAAEMVDGADGCCVDLGGGRRLCAVYGARVEEYRYADGAGRVMRWPAMRGFDPCEFHGDEADLDGDGRSELVVSEHWATSNGMGVAYWNLAIVDGTGRFDAPLLLTVEDLGEGTLADVGGQARVLATEWRYGRDAARGAGHYFRAVPLRYRDGQLVLDPSLPIVSRRLLSSFGAECAKPSPLCWLRSPLTETGVVYDELGEGATEPLQ